MKTIYGLNLAREIYDEQCVYSGIDGVSLQWKIILNALNHKTEGKRLLDLGCGAESGNMESVKYRGEYAPWLGRFIDSTKQSHGLEYIGVDCGDLSREVFLNKQLNLLDKKCLVREFQENYFDIVTAFMLFNSPELERVISGRDRPNASYFSGKTLVDSLIPQLEKIMKPNGILVWYGGDKSLIVSEPKF